MADKSLTKKGQKTKKTLLSATLNLIYEQQSIDKVSVRTIAKRTGLTGSIVTYHFATKNALLDELGKMVMERCRYNPLGDYYAVHAQKLQDKNQTRVFVLGLVDYLIYDSRKKLLKRLKANDKHSYQLSTKVKSIIKNKFKYRKSYR